MASEVAPLSGSQLYDISCASCHGDGGTGHGPAGLELTVMPTDLTNPYAYKHGTDEKSVYHSVWEGIPGTAMVPCKERLSEAEADRVAAFVVLLQGKPSSDAGSWLFQQNCAVCHGEHGDGQFVQHTLDEGPPDLTDPSAYRRGSSRQNVYRSIWDRGRHLDVVSWKGRLTSEQASRVASFVVGLQDADPGRALFRQNCATCHGDEGEGDLHQRRSGLADLRDATTYRHGDDAEKIYRSIWEGYPQSGMLPWKGQLTPEQAVQVATYVASLQGNCRTVRVRAEMDFTESSPAASPGR